MFLTDGQSNYDKILDDLLASLRQTGASANAAFLGGVVRGDKAYVPLFGREWCVEDNGFYKDGKRLDTIGSILMARYLLQGGAAQIAPQMNGSWLPYRDLRDGAQFASYIKAHLEEPMARTFSGRPDVLRGRLEALGARPYGAEIRADLVLVVEPLPKVPVLCLFWDADDEFPASFQFLFDGAAQTYLDLECLAVELQYIFLKINEVA
jgi:hypothetical protein